MLDVDRIRVYRWV